MRPEIVFSFWFFFQTFNCRKPNWARWHRSLIPAVGRERQEDRVQVEPGLNSGDRGAHETKVELTLGF